MMKFLFILLFMKFLILKNKLIYFYYNILFLLSFFFLFNFYMIDYKFYMMSLYFNLDLYSYMLILLSMWILGLIFMSLNFNNIKIFMFLLMKLILFILFSMTNLILFYFFFEFSLIPIFFIIIFWGYNPERLTAALYMLMYTLLISLPLLIYIMYMYMYMKSLDFSILLIKNNMTLSLWSFMIVMGSFFVKLPIFMFHIWLPKAHVEAPSYGSMILAAILLKLGSYGLIRMLMIFIKSSFQFSNFFLSISLMGSLLISLISFIQIDLKSLVAYSSIVHMNMMLCSLLTLNKLGFLSAYMIMISHGLCSSGMFYMVNLFYIRTSSRLLMFNKGMLNILPSFMIWWFMLCSSNFSFPLSFSFISELYLLSVLINWSNKLMLMLIIINFFSSIYSIYLFSFIYHGKLNILNNFFSENMKEIMLTILHYLPLILMMLNMNLF